MSIMTDVKPVPFNQIYIGQQEQSYINEALSNQHLMSNAQFTNRATQALTELTHAKKIYLTNSCTAGLEMAAILADIKPGDEVIMPSFTFVSTATAFVSRGATPVFIDIHPDTLNMDDELIAAAITAKTKAIVPVHYAGVGCRMERIRAIAAQHNLLVIEDAAQGIMAAYQQQPLGSLGHMAAMSFHYTKNITCGLGGALLINDERLTDNANIIWQKGTNRDAFLEGKVDKYTWVDIGSSFMPSEITAAFLLAQLEAAQEITQARLAIWQRYHDAFAAWEQTGFIRRPIIPQDCQHNAHMYYLIMPDKATRSRFMQQLKAKGVDSTFHYIPLHSSPAGQRLGRVHGAMAHTDTMSSRIVRLPLWIGLEPRLDEVINQVIDTLSEIKQ